MRIVCPSCAATYEIADGILTRPKTVRCSRCADQWVQSPVAPPARLMDNVIEPAAPLPTPPPALEPIADIIATPVQAAAVPVPPMPVEVPDPHPQPATEPTPQPERARLTLAWIGSLLLLAALAFVAYKYRVEIQLAWPPSARLFRLLPN